MNVVSHRFRSVWYSRKNKCRVQPQYPDTAPDYHMNLPLYGHIHAKKYDCTLYTPGKAAKSEISGFQYAFYTRRILPPYGAVRPYQYPGTLLEYRQPCIRITR